MTDQLSPTDQLSRADDRLTVPAQGLLHHGHALPQLWATRRLSFRLQVPAATAADLVLAQAERAVHVRLWPIDDHTLLTAPVTTGLPDEWDGILWLTPTLYGFGLPDDLAAALCAAGVSVDELDPARLRYQGALVGVLGHGQQRRDAIEQAVKVLRLMVVRYQGPDPVSGGVGGPAAFEDA